MTFSLMKNNFITRRTIREDVRCNTAYEVVKHLVGTHQKVKFLVIHKSYCVADVREDGTAIHVG